MNWIQIAIAILAVISSLCIVWESIIAPALRLSIRFKLFALRDRVRFAAISNDSQADGQLNVQDAVNAAIYLVHRVTIFDIARMSISAKSPEVQNALAKSPLNTPFGNEIITEAAIQIRQACRINSAGFLLLAFVIYAPLAFSAKANRPVEALIRLGEAGVSKVIPKERWNYCHY